MTEMQAKAGSAEADTPGEPAEKSSDAPASTGSKGAPGSPGGSSVKGVSGVGGAPSGERDSATDGGGAAGGGARGDGVAGIASSSVNATAGASSGGSTPGAGGGNPVGGAKDSGHDDQLGRAVIGRATVGRATVPGGDKPGVKYSRPPGMSPPPDTPSAAKYVASPSGPGIPTGPGVSTGAGSSGTVESVTGIARAGLRGTGVAGTMPLSGVGAAGQTTSVGTQSGTARVTEAVRAARATVSAAAGRGPRRARLHVKRIDPWSVMKFSFAVSFVLFIVIIVATSVLYLALDAMGVFESLNTALAGMVGATGGKDATSLKITAKGIIGGAALVGLVNVVLFTALATLGAFIYNVCADLVGGVEVTLAEKD